MENKEIISIAVGATILAVLILFAAVFAYKRCKKIKKMQKDNSTKDDSKSLGSFTPYHSTQYKHKLTNKELGNVAASFIMHLNTLGVKQLKDGDKIINLNDIDWTQKKGLQEIINAFGKDKIYELGRDLQIESIAFLVKNRGFTQLSLRGLQDVLSRLPYALQNSKAIAHMLFDNRFTLQDGCAVKLFCDARMYNSRYTVNLSNAINFVPLSILKKSSELYPEIFKDEGFCINNEGGYQGCEFLSDGKTVKDNILEAFVKARKIFQPFMNHPKTASDMKYIYDCIGEGGSCIFASTKAKLQSMLDKFGKDLAIMEDSNFRGYVLNDSNASNHDVIKFFKKTLYEGSLSKFNDFTKYKLNFSVCSLRSLECGLSEPFAKDAFYQGVLKNRYLFTIDDVSRMRVDLTQLNDGFSKSSSNLRSADQCKDKKKVDQFEQYKQFLQMCVYEIRKMLSSNVIEQEKENLLIPKLQTTLKNILQIINDWYVLGAVSGLYQYCDMSSERYDTLLSFLGKNNTPSVNFDEPIDIDSLPGLFNNMLSSVDANDKDFSKFCSHNSKEIATKLGSISENVLISKFPDEYRMGRWLDSLVMGYANVIAEGDIDSVKPFSEYFFDMTGCEKCISAIETEEEGAEAKSEQTLFGANLENVVNINQRYS